MKNRLLIAIAFQSAFVLGSRISYAADVEDTEVGVEDMMNDSDAHREAAKAAKDRADKEEKEAVLARDHAKISAEEAKAKTKEANKSILEYEAEYRALKVENAKLRHDINKSDAEIAIIDKSIQKSREKTETSKDGIEALQTVHKEQLLRLSDLQKNQAEVMAERAATKQKLAEAQTEVNATHEKERQAAKELATVKAITQKEKLKAEDQIAHLKAHYTDSVEKTKAMENEIEALHRRTAKLQETAKVGEAEAAQADKHLQETTEKAKAAGITMVKATEEKPAGEQARQVNAVTVASASPIAGDTSAMKLKRDCKVHGQPSTNSATLAVKLGGETLPKYEQQSGWVAFQMDDGQTGFIARSCF